MTGSSPSGGRDGPGRAREMPRHDDRRPVRRIGAAGDETVAEQPAAGDGQAAEQKAPSGHTAAHGHPLRLSVSCWRGVATSPGTHTAAGEENPKVGHPNGRLAGVTGR